MLQLMLMRRSRCFHAMKESKEGAGEAVRLEISRTEV